jgi:class 3 adenylate cyclase
MHQLTTDAGLASLGWTNEDVCSWPGLTCSDNGLLDDIKLSSADLRGSLDALFFSKNFTRSFDCSLASLTLDNNLINGTIPSDITALHSLQRLNLAVNSLSGTIPEGFGSMSALKSIDLSANSLTGPLPSTLCNTSSPLTDIIAISNMLTGNLDVSSCVNLIYLDLSKNLLNGTARGPPRGSNNLHNVHLADNQIGNFSGLISAGVITDLLLDRNPFSDASILAVLTALQSLNALSLSTYDFDPPTFITGSLPSNIFTPATLRSINFNNQFLLRSLPPITGSSLLTSLTFKNNDLSGTIPPSYVGVLAARSAILDLRYNFLCCCGVGELIWWGGNYTNYTGFHVSDLSPSEISVHPGLFVPNVSYASYDFSLPRLPHGLKFSKSLQPVSVPLVSFSGISAGTQANLGNRSYPGLNCPYILREEDEDQQYYFLSGWLLDPEYTLFEGCECDPGLLLVRSIVRGGLPVVECVIPPPPSDPWWVKYWWIFLIIGLLAFLVLLVVVWKASSGARSKVLQEFYDAQRRAKGPPVTGQISIVTTDIQGFSELMRTSPEITMQAVILHNNLLQKARHSCFGYTIESEGDSFSLLFESPADAVKFCIQAQLLLASAAWPKGLYSEPEASFSHDRPSPEASQVRGASPRSKRSFIGLSPPSFTTLSKTPSIQTSIHTSSFHSPKIPPGSHIQGLRVRMGVATGVIEAPTTPASSHVFELAKSVGDAGAGGQILMCSSTFSQVKDLTEELGCMSADGMDNELMKSDKGGWNFWQRKKERLDHEALILHMGDYLHCPEASAIPTILKSSDLKDSKRLLSLYQVLPPKLLPRGRAFGDKLRLKSEWVKVDGGYFDAPGALGFSLGASDKGRDDVLDPFLATVFLQVDGGKAYAAKHRADAAEVHSILLALIKTTLRLTNPGGYLNKAQDNELKYLLTFSTTEAAIYCCAQMQLASVFASWPPSALKHWPEEKSTRPDGTLLFRGPRIKMGLSEGHVNRIAADWTGRADVHGPSVNQAARFMDAAAWGGQIAAEEAVAVKVMGAMTQASLDFFSRSTLEDISVAGPGLLSKSSFSKDIALGMRPISLQDLQPDMTEEASLEGISPFSLSRAGSARPSSRPSKPFSASGISFSVKHNTTSRVSWALPDEHLLCRSDPMSLVCQKLGRFTFRGSDEIIDMVSLSPATLLARQFPTDAPMGKGERVSRPAGPEEVVRAELPSMFFIQELRGQYLTHLAQSNPTRPEVRKRAGASRLGRFDGMGGLMRVTEEMEGSEADRNSIRPSVLGWGRTDSRSSQTSQQAEGTGGI